MPALSAGHRRGVGGAESGGLGERGGSGGGGGGSPPGPPPGGFLRQFTETRKGALTGARHAQGHDRHSVVPCVVRRPVFRGVHGVRGVHRGRGSRARGILAGGSRPAQGHEGRGWPPSDRHPCRRRERCAGTGAREAAGAAAGRWQPGAGPGRGRRVLARRPAVARAALRRLGHPVRGRRSGRPARRPAAGGPMPCCSM